MNMILPLLLAAIPAAAHYDAPREPATKTHIELLSVLIEDDGDPDVFFGWDDFGTVEIQTNVEQSGHPGDKEEHRYGTYSVNDKGANTITINQPIYRHTECNPVEEPINLLLHAYDVDLISNDDIVKIAQNAPVKSSATQVVGAVGQATFNYRIMVVPEPSLNANCVSASTKTTMIPGIDLTPGHLAVVPGRPAEVAVSVTNRAESPLRLRLAVDRLVDPRSPERGPRRSDRPAADPAWFSWGKEPTLELAPGQTATVPLTVKTPADLAGAAYGYKIYARTPNGGGQVEYAYVDVGQSVATPAGASLAEAAREDRAQGLALLILLAAGLAWALRSRRRKD